METESKYLKKIRDEIEKKSGKTKEHTGPNTVANYLNDIAKGVKDLDVGGGGGGTVEGPFSFTNETTDTSGLFDCEYKAQVTDKKILYSNIEKDKTTGDIKNTFTVTMNAPNKSNPHAGMKFESLNSRFGDLELSTSVFDGNISVEYEKDNVEKSITVNYDDITTGDSNTWDGNNTSLKAALSRLPAVMKFITSSSGTIEAGEDVDFNMTLDSTVLRNIRDIHSWSVLCSQDTVRYITLPIKNLRFTQSDTIGVGHPHMMQFTLENNTGSDIVLNEVVLTLLYYRKSSYT